MKSIKENEEFIMGTGVFIYTINPDNKSIQLKLVRKAGNKKETIHPTEQEVKDYFKQKGYNEESAARFYNGYAVNNWRDSNNKEIKNWRMKAVQVWFTEKNKIVTPSLNPNTPSIKFFQ